MDLLVLSCLVVVMGTTSTYVEGATLQHSHMELRTVLGRGFVSHGCWKDQAERAIDGFEGDLGVEGCYERAKDLGNAYFAVQYNGQCFTSSTAGDTYKRYGSSNDCKADGTGGTWCMEVYEIVCPVGELALQDTYKCQLNGYTCTTGDGPRCCEGRQEETRMCVPCDETIHKKPKGTKYTRSGTCDFDISENSAPITAALTTASHATAAPVCEDFDSFCPEWASAGYCQHTYLNYMTNNCKESCGLCSLDSCNVCSDQFTDEKCEEYKGFGYCTNDWSDHMIKNCNQTCGYCDSPYTCITHAYCKGDHGSTIVGTENELATQCANDPRCVGYDYFTSTASGKHCYSSDAAWDPKNSKNGNGYHKLCLSGLPSKWFIGSCRFGNDGRSIIRDSQHTPVLQCIALCKDEPDCTAVSFWPSQQKCRLYKDGPYTYGTGHWDYRCYPMAGDNEGGCVTTTETPDCAASAEKCIGQCQDTYDAKKAYYCSKGCAGVSGGKVTDLYKYCGTWHHSTYDTCTKNCKGASSGQSNRDICKEGCKFWKEAPSTAAPTTAAPTNSDQVIVRLHFNETCCSAGGVPEQCMGLCREKVEDRSLEDEERNGLVMPVDQCEEHRDTIRKCMVQEVHCEWNDWQLGQCSKTCGGGTRSNTRTKKIEEENGGTCEGEAVMDDVCNTEACPPIHCVWNEWVTGVCSDTCGTGTRTNTRTKLVTESNGGTCTGPPTEIEECNTNPCPVDCVWNDWTIGDCSASCGGGNLTKIRTPEVDAQHGGQECTGHSQITESCNVQECPVHCVWNEWVLGECSVTCGGGSQTDTRDHWQEALFGGNPCEGESTHTKDCNPDPCPVDCEWNEWVLGDCSTTCGNGTKFNTRTKWQEELHGGMCEGEPTATVDCNLMVCPPVHCVWNEWVLGDCSRSCGTGTRKNHRTKLVHEEFGGTCTGQPSEIEECLIVECPIHCEWDDWVMGHCDKTCGGGLLTKTRQPLQDAQHGGNNCTGDSQIVESCNIQECPVDCVWNEWVSGTCSRTCGPGILVDTRDKLQEAMFNGTECDGEPTRQTDCSIAECPIVFHFNETCCEVNGVTEHCMGLCRERLDERIEVILPIDQCVVFKDIIRSCLYSESGHTLEEAHAIFPKSRSLFGSIMDWINY